MKIAIFDTECLSIDKLYCYNVGYVIYDTDTAEILYTADRVCEQIWHNLPLFNTAYYAEKRPLYVAAMKAHTAKMDKYGYICAEMRRVFKRYEVECAYAYNSPFDEKVFAFNCDWFKCINPFDEIPVYDIRALAINHICTSDEYKSFCEDNQLFTESGNYSTTAEAVYRFITKDPTFEEAHTALSDSMIECDILNAAVRYGAAYGEDEEAPNMVVRDIPQHWEVKDGQEKLCEFDCTRVVFHKTNKKIYIYH